jgi:predicted MFS family arabinose efflux permease
MTQYMGAAQNLLPFLFLSGGIAGYLSTKITGILISHLSALMLATISTLLFVASLLLPAMGYHNAVLFITLFLVLHIADLFAASSVAVRYPEDEQRASLLHYRQQ